MEAWIRFLRRRLLYIRLRTMMVIVLSLVIASAISGKRWLLVMVVLYLGVYFLHFGVVACRNVDQWMAYLRWRRGECIRCGYSLWMNESGVCPECGQRAPPPPAETVQAVEGMSGEK